MSRRFRICMAKGGRESLRPSYGGPKLTLLSRERKKTFGGVGKSREVTIFNFQTMISPKRDCIIAIYRVMFVIGDSLKS